MVRETVELYRELLDDQASQSVPLAAISEAR
jgi:hypothetical protein